MKKLELHSTGFDLDGVIADTGEAFVRLACEEYGYCSFGLEDITSFDIEQCLQIPAELVSKIFTDILVDSVGCNLQPIPGAVQTISRISEHGPVHVVTARDLANPVIDWFDAHFPAEVARSIHLVTTGDHDDKARFINQLNLNCFIDDRAATCIELANHGITAIVYSQPWNVGQHSLPCVTGWDEIGKLAGLGEK